MPTEKKIEDAINKAIEARERARRQSQLEIAEMHSIAPSRVLALSTEGQEDSFSRELFPGAYDYANLCKSLFQALIENGGENAAIKEQLLLANACYEAEVECRDAYEKAGMEFMLHTIEDDDLLQDADIISKIIKQLSTHASRLGTVVEENEEDEEDEASDQKANVNEHVESPLVPLARETRRSTGTRFHKDMLEAANKYLQARQKYLTESKGLKFVRRI